MLTTTKKKWIFEDSSEVREAYDQQVGGHISQKDMTCMRLEIITRMKIKTMGLQDFRVYYFFKYKISENLHYTTIPASSFVLINRMCSILILRIIIRKDLSGFQTSASSRSPRKHNSILNTPLPCSIWKISLLLTFQDNWAFPKMLWKNWCSLVLFMLHSPH